MPIHSRDEQKQSGSTSADGRSPKRRKIRKGTHSCWACKRKKIRCTFSTPDGEPVDLETLENPSEALAGEVCDGCRRRGTPCISQELPETAALSAAANHSRQVDDRLGRMEALVEMLVKNAARGEPISSSSASIASPRPEMFLSGPTASKQRDGDQQPPGTSTPAADCFPANRRVRPDGSDSEDEGPADLGPDSLQKNPETSAIAAHRAPQLGMNATSEAYSRESTSHGPTTYTTWFGHERGIGDEEQPGTLPPPTTVGPGTPASCPSTRSTCAANNSRTASTACTVPSPADISNMVGSATDGPARQAPYLSANRMHQEYMSRYKTLASTWPSPADLEIILKALERPVRSGLHKVLVYSPFSAVTAAESPPICRESARSVLKLPPVGAHLVLVAQTLLYLASFLQHMHPMFDPDLKSLSMPHRELIQRIMCATTTVVTGNDSLIGSFEGVQCLVMQGVIQSNQGNLRRAWLAFRRAMTMTQLMGLHRGFPGTSLKMLDPTAPPPIMPKCMWFRILYADRYLSLMLGLPQGLPGDSHVLCPGTKRKSKNSTKSKMPPAMEEYINMFDFGDSWHELRKIEEAHAIIAGRIIERNEAWRSEEDDKLMRDEWGIDSDDFEDEGGADTDDTDNLDNDLSNPYSTQSIDLALQNASRSVPAQWWLTPFINDGSSGEGDGASNFMRTQQLIDQLFHYHLLTQLHLPYMLRRGSDTNKPYHLARGDGECSMTSTEPEDRGMSGSAGSVDKYAYSKITCVSASREVLGRFLSLRSNKQVAFFTRCIDFFALLASMTLCLAHLDSHRNEQMMLQKQPKRDRKSMAANDFLAHQRLSDRGMMERVLQSMDEMAKINEDDALSSKSAAFLRRMLDVEHDASLAVAASLGCPDAKVEIERREAESNASNIDGDMRVWVPFLGTIRINKEGILRVKGNECSLKLPTEENPAQTPAGNKDASESKAASAGADFTDRTLIDAPDPLLADAQPFGANGIQGASFAATYPTLASGAGPTLNSHSGIGLQAPTWSSGDPYVPNNNPGAANPYMFYTSDGVTSSSNPLVDGNNNPDGGINAAVFGGFGNYGSDGYGNGSGGGYGNGSYRGILQGDDWTLQGVDFAFFENLLMHGALVNNNVDDTATGDANASTAASSGAADESDGATTTASADGKIAMDANGPIPVQPADGGGPEDDIILTNSRRPGKLGENMLWM